ncbi:MAG: glycosyltransferase [Longimicrobiaceae bacterium]
MRLADPAQQAPAARAPAPEGRRVVHVITMIARGGAENHLMDLVRYQVAHGCRVSVAFLKGDPYWAAELRRLGVAVVPLGLRFYGDPLPLVRLRRLLSAAAPELVHAHLPPAELYVRAALAGGGPGGVPLVISKHNDSPFRRGDPRLVLPVARWVGRRADAVVAISESVRRRVLRDGLAASPSRVVTVPYGLDAAPFLERDEAAVRRLRAEWGAGEGTVLFGTVARMVPQKSLHTLLEGFARLRASRPAADLRLVLAGTGPLERALRGRAEALGIAERCVWAGFREDIVRVMQALDVFVLTSLWEGFGLVLLEAMAAARPVAASAASAIPEIVVDGCTGRLFAPGDPEGLRAALDELLDPARRRAYGAAGRERARSFSVERMGAATADLYERVLAGRAAVRGPAGRGRP